MILGAKARYAVMALVDLASRDSDQPVKLADLAEKQNIPLPYLEQIFVQLRQANLVQSVRGPKGGYTLSAAADATNVASIVEAVDEPLKMTRCKDGHAPKGCLPGSAQCMTHELWDGLGNHIYDYLSGISLASICKQQGDSAAMKITKFEAING